MRIQLALIILLTLTISCSHENKNEEGYTLNGRSINLKDGTKLELFDAVSLATIDSTIVKNGKFEIQGKLDVSSTIAHIMVREPYEYRWLWLENKSMVIDGTGTDFAKSKVTGSSIHDLAETIYAKMEADRDHEEIIAMNFISQNPNSIISAELLSAYSINWGARKVEELYTPLSQQNKNTYFGKEIVKYLEHNRILQIGDAFADFDMKNNAGENIRLSDHLGKVTLLEFWSSSCGPCRKENPNLKKTYDKYNKAGFEIFAVSTDTKESSWKEAIEKDKLTWTHASDLESSNKASLIYGITSIPDNFLIDKNGNIIGRNLKGSSLSSALEKLLH